MLHTCFYFIIIISFFVTKHETLYRTSEKYKTKQKNEFYNRNESSNCENFENQTRMNEFLLS